MITGKDIIKEGHTTLNQKAAEVSLPLNQEDKNTLKLLEEYLINSQDDELVEKYNLRPGVGLAAPQINVSKRMLAVDTPDEKGTLYKYLLVNPKIVSHSVKQTYLPFGEGCLSVDRETEGFVKRYEKIRVKGFNYNTTTDELTEVDLRLKGYVSIVFQHEIDHLNGILYTSKLTHDVSDIEPVEFE